MKLACLHTMWADELGAVFCPSGTSPLGRKSSRKNSDLRSFPEDRVGNLNILIKGDEDSTNPHFPIFIFSVCHRIFITHRHCRHMAWDIRVDDDVRNYILEQEQDFRVCTACTGPALVPITVKPPKKNDRMIPIGDYVLYISAVQAMYINRVSMDMLYSDEDIATCYAFNRGRYY